MTQSNGYQRIAWEDRFNEPSIDALRSALPAASTPYFDQIRADLAAIDGVRERLAWYGECWRWSIEYRVNPQKKDHEHPPVAVLIPAPDDLQVAIPLTRELVEQLAEHSLKRAIRDGLELAQPPFDTRWGVWSIQNATFWKDLKRVLNRKLEYAQ